MTRAPSGAVMRAARWLAITVITGVGTAAFVLSFAALRELAVQAHVPARCGWLFPLIVDGTIIQATISLLVTTDSPHRRWFLWVLAAGAGVSVTGNCLHAIAAGHTLPWWACALVAAIAPVSLLADTHGLALLFRTTHQDNAAPDPAPVDPNPLGEAGAGQSQSPRVKPVRTRRDPAVVARAVAMRAEGKTYADIGKSLGVSPRTAANYAPATGATPRGGASSTQPPATQPATTSAGSGSMARSIVSRARPTPAPPMLPVAMPMPIGGV